MRPPITEAEVDGRRRAARVLAALIAATMTLRLLDDRLSQDDGSPVWLAASVLAFAGGVALMWRANPPWAAAFALFMTGIGASALGTFGDDAFSRIVVAFCAGVLALYVAACCVVVPIVLRIRGRWPVAGPAFEPIADAAALAGAEPPPAAALMRIVDALTAIGFMPRARTFASAPEGRFDAVLFLHGSLPVFGLAGRLVTPQKTTALLQFSVVPPAGETASCTVADALAPDPFPLKHGDRVFLFPGRSPAQLLDIVRRLSPTTARVVRMPSPDEVIDFMSHIPDERLRLLLDRGYLDSNVVEGAHRFTWKGALVAAYRSLWPASAIIRWRRRRAADAALRAAPPLP